MAKNSIRDYDATSGNNTDVQSVDISEGCAASGINNALREIMTDLKNVSTGAVALETPAADQLNVDNIRLDGNTISSTDTNGDITLDPNGTGDTIIASGNLGIGDATPIALLTMLAADGVMADQYVAKFTNSEATTGQNYGVFVAGGSSSADESFGVRNFDSSATYFKVRGDGNVGIGTASPAATTHSHSSVAGGGHVRSSSSSLNNFIDIGTDSGGHGVINIGTAGGNMNFQTAGTERMRIDSSGNVLVGGTNSTPHNLTSGGGFSVRGSLNLLSVARQDNEAMILNRTGTDGDIAKFRKNGSSVGSIGSHNGGGIYVADNTVGFRFDDNGTDNILPCNGAGATADNSIDLGVASARFDDIFATNTSIQTSDRNEKQDIASLTTAEITAAKAISKLFKTFKWNDKVAAKGDAARTHSGVIAQEVQTAMADAGLDAAGYAFWCSDTWWETSTDVAAVEADEEAGIEAKDAYTRIDTYQTADEAPEGATQRTRLGIRYAELLAFIGAATEQRLADIETRLTALENA